MAVAQVRVLPTSGTQGNNTNTITVAFDATGCDYLIVRFTYGADAGGSVATFTVTTATYAGVAMSALKAFRVNSGSNSAGQATYGIATPATGTNNVVITMSGSPGSPRLNLEIIGLSGVGSAALAASNDDTNATQSALLSGTLLAAGDMVVGCFNHGDTISGAATGTQATVNNYSTTTAGSCGIIITNTGTGTVSVRGNSSVSDHWMGDAVQLTAAASASNPYYLDRTKLEPPGNLGPGSTWARPIGSYAATAVANDVSVTGLLASGAALYGTSTHDASAAGYLASGAVLYGPTTHDATVVGQLASGAALYSSSGTLAYIVTGFLASGAAFYAPISHDVPVAGFLASGAELHGAISHGATVTGLLASGAVLYAPVTHDATVAGLLASGGVLYGLLTTGSDISVVGLLVSGAGLWAPVSHAASASGLLIAGAELHGAVSHGATVAGLLTGGATLLGGVTHSITLVGRLVSGGVLYALYIAAGPDPILEPPLSTIFANNGARLTSGPNLATQTTATDVGLRATHFASNGVTHTENSTP